MTLHAQPTPLMGELLVQEAAITRAQLEEALETQRVDGGKLAEILIRKQCLDVDTFGRIMARRPGIVSMNLGRYKLSRDLCELIPEEFAIAHQLFPVDRMGKTLTVAMAVPIDTATIAAIREMTGLRVQAFRCDLAEVRAAIDKFYRPFGEVSWAHVLETGRGTKNGRRRADSEPPSPQSVSGATQP